MPKLSYVAPSGEEIRAVTLEHVLTCLRAGDEYWGPYSPQAYLQTDGLTRFLTVSRHPRRGWYLEHCRRWWRWQWHKVAVRPTGGRNAWVEHYMNGDPMYILAACFLPLASAERAVADFIATDKLPRGVNWERADWDLHLREYPPDDESLVIEWVGQTA